jgi:ABC-type glycerol-3-phosphate transport system substrate-binding protein
MVMMKSKAAAFGALLAVAVACAALAAKTGAQEAGRALRPEAADEKRWQAVAPGRVEPAGGEI